MAETISSLHNQRVKDVVKLNRRNQRARRRATVVEGLRESQLALESGIIPLEAYICPALSRRMDAVTASELQGRVAQLAKQLDFPLFEVTPAVYEKMAYRGQSGGILLVIPYLRNALADQIVRPDAFYVVIEGVEKPGNLGAILRTADAAGVDGVIVCSGGTDIHNPNVIRASLGALFTVPVIEATTQETLDWLRLHRIEVIVTSPAATHRYTDIDLTGPVAIVLGSEASGISKAWFAAAQRIVSIPMFGRTNSLNLSTSTALLLYEAVRQRQQASATSTC